MNTSTLKQEAREARDKAGETAEAAKNKAQGVLETVKEKAGDVASAVGNTADKAVESVGSGMQSVAGAIRGHAPRGGVVGGAASAVAGGLKNAGEYLESHGLSGIGKDLAGVIRRHPVMAVLVGVGVGFLLSRTLSR
jgi:hypothetical protein